MMEHVRSDLPPLAADPPGDRRGRPRAAGACAVPPFRLRSDAMGDLTSHDGYLEPCRSATGSGPVQGRPLPCGGEGARDRPSTWRRRPAPVGSFACGRRRPARTAPAGDGDGGGRRESLLHARPLMPGTAGRRRPALGGARPAPGGTASTFRDPNRARPAWFPIQSPDRRLRRHAAPSAGCDLPCPSRAPSSARTGSHPTPLWDASSPSQL